MLREKKRLAIAVLLAGLVMVLVSGCGKYDALERNMQYVSDDLLRQEAATDYQSVVKTHEQWRSSGGGRESNNQAFSAYKDAYAQYAVVYNELRDRQNGSFGSYLHSATDELPPPPPGQPAAASVKHSEAPASSSETPLQSRDLKDALPTQPTSGLSVPAVPPRPAQPARGENPFALDAATAAAIGGKAPAKVAAKTTVANGDAYTIAPGDTLRTIAKRHGITEKSLMDANGITDPDKIAAGKTLTIPTR